MSVKTKILIAEDDGYGAKILIKSLQLLGYDVAGVVTEGEDAVDKAIKLQPDLIVMDVTLGGEMDGIRAAERLHAVTDIPVIFLTAHTEEQVFERAKAAAPYAFLTKPYEIIQLSHAIELALVKHHLGKQLQESENRYHIIFDVSENAMMIIDQENMILMINREFERLTGFTREQVVLKMLWTEFLADNDQATVKRLQLQDSHKTDIPLSRFEASLIDCNCQPVTVSATVRKIPASQTYVISMTDMRELTKAGNEIVQLNRELSNVNNELVQEIAERKKFEKQLKHQANHDPLTGLPNRVLLFELMKQSFAFEDRHNKMLALMLFDLDNFKQINDTLGHLSGDILLKKVARRLQSCMRQYDTVGRLGGDEFIIVVNDISRVNDIVNFTKKLLEAFQQPFDILGQSVTVTASIGVSIYPVHGVTVKTLLKMADCAMYTAKKAGKNMFHFFSDSTEQRDASQIPLQNAPRYESGQRLYRNSIAKAS